MTSEKLDKANDLSKEIYALQREIDDMERLGNWKHKTFDQRNRQRYHNQRKRYSQSCSRAFRIHVKTKACRIGKGV